MIPSSIFGHRRNENREREILAMTHTYLCVVSTDGSIVWYDNGKLCGVPAQLLLQHTLSVFRPMTG